MQINVKISQYAKHAAEIPLPKTCQSNRGPGGTGWGWCTKHWHLTRQVSEPLVALVVCGHCWSVLWSEGYCRRCEKRELKTWLSSGQPAYAKLQLRSGNVCEAFLPLSWQTMKNSSPCIARLATITANAIWWSMMMRKYWQWAKRFVLFYENLSRQFWFWNSWKCVT